MKDIEREGKSLNQEPGNNAIKVELDWVRLHLPNLQDHDRPHCQVCNEEERHDLTTWFRSRMLRHVNTTTSNVRDEQHLKNDLRRK